MQTISGNFQTALNDAAQTVRPKVIITWADSRYLPNARIHSSGDWYADVIKQNTPLAWYRLGDTTGNVMADASGNGLDGLYNVGFTLGVSGIPSESDTAVSFNGSSGWGQVTEASAGTALRLTDGWTIEAWARPATTGSEMTVMCKASANTVGAMMYRLYLNSSGYWACNVTDHAGTSKTITSSVAADTSNYHHLMAFKSGSLLTFVVNGTNVYTDNTLDPGAINQDSGDFAIGRIPSATTWFNGRIDEVAVYKTLLTQGDAQHRYEMGIRPTDIPAARRFNSVQAFNGYNRGTLKWGVTDATDETGGTICCDQGYRVMDDYNYAPIYPNAPVSTALGYEYGWWSRRKSQSNGVFASYGEVIWADFDQREATAVEVYTSEFYGPIYQYTVWYKDTNSTWNQIGGTQTMLAGTVMNSHDLGGQKTITGVKVIVLSTYQGNQPARIQEINPVFQQDISADVVSLAVDLKRETFDSTVPVGITSANQAQLELDNTDLKYDIKGSGTLAPYIRKDVKLVVSYGWQLADGSFEYVQKGIFYVDQWTVDSSNMTVNADCRDFSRFLMDEPMDTGFLVLDQTVGQACANLAARGGVPREKIIFVNTWFGTVAADRPYAWYRMNEVSGTVLNDTLNITNGTISGSPPLGQQGGIPSDSPSYAMSLNGSSQYASCPTTNNIDLTSLWSIELVINLTSSLSNDGVVVSHEGTGSTTAGAYKISVTTGGEIKYETQGSSTVTTSTAGVLGGTGWHHVVVTFNSNASPSMNIYVDGVAKGSGNPTAPSSLSNGLLIGRQGGGTPNYFQGRIDEVILYKRELSASRVALHFSASRYVAQTIFPYLFAKDTTIWEGMTTIATADLGMFYFDEYENYHFENADFFYSTSDPTNTSHSTVQYNLSDSTNIVSASEVINIQANAVTVQTNPKSIINIGQQGIWVASGTETLAVINFGYTIGRGDTSIFVASTDNPPWPSSGEFKIDNEVITYASKTSTSFDGLQRGQYGTSPSSHSAGLLREHRTYQAQYSNAPALSVFYPLIAAQIFDGTVDIDEFNPTPWSALVRVSANKKNSAGDIIYLQGTNPISKLNYYFAIAGVPITTKKQAGQVTSQTLVNTDNRRRYGLKKIEINNEFIQDKDQAKKIADFIIAHYADPTPIIEVKCMGIPHLQLGDRVRITNFAQMGITNVDYWVIESKMDHKGHMEHALTLREVS